MAKKRRTTAAPAAPRTIVLRQQAAPPARRARTRIKEVVVRGARRAAGAARSAAAQTQVQLATVGGGAGLALLERSGRSAPTIGGFDGALVTGLALAFGPALLKWRSKNAALLSCAGTGVLTVGVHRSLLRGSARVGEDEEDYD